MTDPIIKFEHVSKKYPDTAGKIAVSDFSLEIIPGELFCLIGPSGCGKSTVLKIVAGLEKISSGSITKPNTVAMVFQSGALFPWMSTEDNISFGLRMKGMSSSKTREKTREYLKMVKLEGFEKKYPRDLSGGQRQRVGIARALALETEVLLLDEPFSALDPVTTDELHLDLLKIWKDTGKTIVMVSHSLEEAVFLADRIGIMENGGLKEVLDNNLPRPRADEGKVVIAQIEKIRQKLENSEN